ncbi:MAG: pyridoxamine 5'-phosphate oxidase family protein [Bacillota bacterium]
MKLSEKQVAMMGVMTTVKFLATSGGGGRVNVAPILTTCHYKDDLVIFGDFIMWKTKQNLLENERAGILVIDEKLNYFNIDGIFTGFETKGDAFDFMNASPMVKYNAYTGIRSAGLIRAESVSPVRTVGKLKIVRELVPSVLARSRMSIKRVVGEKFERVKALKTLAYIENGRPVAVPVPVVRVDGNTMVFRNSTCPGGVFAAMAVITMDPVTYQVKGTLAREKDVCRLRVEEIYSGGVPLPGRRIS